MLSSRSRLLAALLLAAGCATTQQSAADEACVPEGRWVLPRTGGIVSEQHAIAQAARADVVLLGEEHTSAEDHAWQLQTLAALAARRDLAIGLEMFPRRVQPALDAWVAGKLSRSAFLEQSEWNTVWGFDASLYMPIFEFARMHRVPLVALNIERSVVSTVGAEGWDALSSEQRGGLTHPAEPAAPYVKSLAEIWAQHLPADDVEDAEETDGETPAVDLADPAFARFVMAQTVWDRAMAESAADARKRYPKRLVVCLTGEGHVQYGWGIARQLRDLGVRDTYLLLPWDIEADCAELEPGIADAVFGVSYSEEAEDAWRPLLGVRIGDQDAGITVLEVVDDSVAAACGIQVGDVIRAAAGLPVAKTGDLIAIVQRQAPGTWLPLTVVRAEDSLEILAKFPPQE